MLFILGCERKTGSDLARIHKAVATPVRGRGCLFTLLPRFETLVRGNPIYCCPRFWSAIFATDCAPHPRTKCLFGGAAMHRESGRNPQLLAARHHSVWWTLVGV